MVPTPVTSATESSYDRPILCQGHRHSEVMDIRNLLTQWGLEASYPDPDYFDDQLDVLVRLFQYRVFLKEDGVVGPLTWQALTMGAPVNMPLLMQGSLCSAVVTLQRVLQITGDYRGMTDGEFGLLTDQAVRSFQRRQGIAVDGFVNFRTWRALSRAMH